MRPAFNKRQRPFLASANVRQLLLQRCDAIEQEHQLHVCGTVQAIRRRLAFAHHGPLLERRSVLVVGQNGIPCRMTAPVSSTASIDTRSRVSSDLPGLWVIRQT